MNAKEQLIKWLSRTKYYTSVDLESYIRTAGEDDPHEGDTHRITLYTANYEYHIVATGGSDYLGCTMNARKPLPGEDWTRGRDLADGKLNDETWCHILSDIVAYELVEGDG